MLSVADFLLLVVQCMKGCLSHVCRETAVANKFNPAIRQWITVLGKRSVLLPLSTDYPPPPPFFFFYSLSQSLMFPSALFSTLNHSFVCMTNDGCFTEK